jgi:L-rhamnose mutarotase
MADLEKVSKELHKQITRKFQRRKVYVSEVNEVWGADLTDLQYWKDKNNGYRYILTVIDVLSKYAWAVPLKDKTAKEVAKAFEEIFKEAIPQKVWTDQGSEFYNSTVKTLFKKHNIQLYSTYGDHKSAVVERFNRTMKAKMYKSFTKNNNRKWVEVLPELLKNYNSTKHRTIKMTPNAAIIPKNYDQLMFNFMNSGKSTKEAAPKLKAGDYVRIQRIKGTFEKGETANWSMEIFKIKEVLKTHPVTYKIEEFDGSPIEGSFYEQELQKTEQTEVFFVEKVLKKRTVKGKKQLFVKWLGWDKKYNSWIDESEVVEKY